MKGTCKARATQKQDCRKKWATQGQRFRALPLRCPGQRFRALPLRCPAAAGQRMGNARAALPLRCPPCCCPCVAFALPLRCLCGALAFVLLLLCRCLSHCPAPALHPQNNNALRCPCCVQWFFAFVVLARIVHPPDVYQYPTSNYLFVSLSLSL